MTMNNAPSLLEPLLRIARDAPANLPPHNVLGRPFFFFNHDQR